MDWHGNLSNRSLGMRAIDQHLLNLSLYAGMKANLRLVSD
jgi:hypothetical protein